MEKGYFENITELERIAYSYVLGLYLGNGYINSTERTHRLRITMPTKYPLVTSLALSQLGVLFPKNKIGNVKRKKEECSDLSVYSNKLPEMFPQHGVGKKHERNVSLNSKQERIVSTKHLLLGLFHTDGSYYLDRRKNASYPVYHFKNNSQDIHNIFRKCCDEFEVRWTTGENVTQIRTLKDVELLRPILGTKEEVIKI